MQLERGHLAAATSPSCLLKDFKSISEALRVCGLQAEISCSKKDMSFPVELIKKIKNVGG